MIKKRKRFAIWLIVAFMSIVTGLTVSSKLLNDKKVEENLAVRPSTKAIVNPVDTDSFEQELSEGNINYTRIGNAVYVVDYVDAQVAEKAVQELNEANKATASPDTYFLVSGLVNHPANIANKIVDSSAIPEGMSLRDYADANGYKLVAVIDTGVDSSIATVSKNFTDDPDGDNNGHGTSVANAIVANAQDKAIILDLKAMNDDGTGYMSNIMEAVQYAREQCVDIINMSISAPYDSSASAFEQLIESTISDGIKVVAAAGNYNSSAKAYMPSCIDGVISVGAIDENGNKIESSNYGATYYEKADSTSEATGILTGKLVNGESLNNENTESTIKYDKTNIESSLLRKTTKNVQYGENSVVITQNFDFNISPEIREKIAISTAGHYISSECAISDLKKYGEELYDSQYGAYHYVFDSEEKYEQASKTLNNISVDGFVFSSVKEPLFQTQQDFTGGEKWSIKLSVSQSGNTTSWTVYACSDQYRSCTSRGMSWSVNIGGCSHSGTNSNVTIGKNSCGAIASGSCTSRYGTISVSASISRSGNWTNAWSSSSCSGSFATGNSAPPVVTYGVLNVNLLDPNGIERTDGSIGTFSYTYSNWGESGKQHVSDCYEQKANGTLYRVGQLSLKNGLLYTGIDGYSGQVKEDTVVGNGFVKSVNGTTNVNIRTRWSTVTINPNGGRYNNVTSNTSVSSNGVDATFTGMPTHDPYKITLDANGGSCSKDSVNANVSFSSWTLSKGSSPSGNGQGWLDGNTYHFGTSDDTLKANWGYGKVSSYPEPTRTGYTFNGWWTAKTGGTRVDTNTGYSYSQTIYAHWIANNYTLTAHANGANAKLLGGNFNNDTDASVTVTYDSTNYYILGTASRTGYTFEGFYTGKSKDGSKIFDANGYATNEGTYWKDNKWHATSNLDVYAGWTAHKYTIKFDGNQGYVPTGSIETVQGSMNDQGRVYDDGTKLPDVGFTWQGHTFLGWSTNANATTPTWENKSTANITADDNATVTLYAVWSTNTFTANINPTEGTWNGTSANQTNTQLWGTEIDLGQPIPNDKTAVITYANIDGAENARESDTIQWVFNNWSLADNDHGFFDQKYGTHASASGKYTFQASNDTITANYYYTTVVLPSPTKEGLTFLGWYKDANFMKKAGNGGETYRAPESETLYARWEKNTFNYSDTIQAFMQDKSGTTEGVFIRKVNKDTGEVLTSVMNKGFTIGIYESNVSNRNLVLTIDTSKGVYNKQNQLVVSNKDRDGNGYYSIGNYLKIGETYVVHEISSAPGYTKDTDQTFTYYDGKRISINVEDKKNNPPIVEHPHKLDKYGRPIKNAVFQLKDETTGQIVSTVKDALKTDENGKLNSAFLYELCEAGHRYSLTEIEVPEGYEKAPVTYFTMPEMNGEEMPEIQIEEPTKEASKLKIRKVDSDDNPLAGATFDLYMKDDQGNMVACMMDKSTGDWVNETTESENVVKMSLTTDSNGEITFTNLPLRASFTGSEPDFTKSYYLVETKSPDGYSLLTEPIEIRLPDDGNTEFTYTVKDDSVVLTLEAGGKGNMIYYVGGMLLVACGVFATIIKKRKHA